MFLQDKIQSSVEWTKNAWIVNPYRTRSDYRRTTALTRHATMDAASHSVSRQTELKQKLRKALEDGNEESCWAMIERNSDVGKVPQDIMKLLAVNSRFYSFMSHSQRVTDYKADNWLLHEDEFYVHWVGGGHNAFGAMITGEELESSFFMYQMEDT